jgi:hypothetical protein
MINKITEYVRRDPETFEYYMEKDFNENQLLVDFKKYVASDGKILLPFVSEVVSEVFPFIQTGIKQDIINKSIEQGNCVHDLVSRSIKARKQEKIELVKNECKNPNHIAIAVKIISVLNSFIYKHKIKYIYSEETFLSFSKFLYLGTPDIIMVGERDCYIIDIKTSRVNYVEKAEAQLFLYREMLESSGMKVHSAYIVNPRENITVQEARIPETNIKKKLYFIIQSGFNLIS